MRNFGRASAVGAFCFLLKVVLAADQSLTLLTEL